MRASAGRACAGRCRSQAKNRNETTKPATTQPTRRARSAVTSADGICKNVVAHVHAEHGGKRGCASGNPVDELRPDVILMDLRMPRVDGVEATRRLRASHPEIKVIVLTTYADDRSVIEALRAGALGYLTKDAGADEIRQALQRVASGQASLDPAVQLHLVEAIATTSAAPDTSATPVAGLPDGLTPREAEVLGLIGAGVSNTEIAAQLFVSEATVKSHVNHMLPKIGARDRAQAVGYAYRHGLVPPGPVRR